MVVRKDGSSNLPIFLITAALVVACFWVVMQNPAGSPEQVVEAPETGSKPAAPAIVVAPKPAVVPEIEIAPEPIISQSISEKRTPDLPTRVIPEKTEEVEPLDPFKDEPALVLLGIDATSSTAVARDAALLETASAESAWDSYRELLARSLTESIAKTNFSNDVKVAENLWKSPVFYQAFLRWRLLQQIPAATIRTEKRDASSLFQWLMVSNAPMEEMLLTIQEGDDLPRVIDILYDNWYTDTDMGEKYFNLALACAVVFDRDLKVEHPTESMEYGAEVLIEPYGRYRWYVDKNEAGKLATSINRMSARDLVWVVCAPVSTSELEWAISKMRLKRGKWGNAYGMVDYLMERAVEGLNPYTEYTFAQILKEGGICGDQSYFCVNTARANGIPAMILSGETDLGGHAWAAVKIKSDEWSTMIGRIGGVSNGEASNPQVGGRTTEQEIWLWNEKAQKSQLRTLAVWRNLWLADFFEATKADDSFIEAAVYRAHDLGKSFTETWQRVHGLLAKKTREAEDPANKEILGLWVQFISKMRAEFRENPRMADLASKAEDEFIFPYTDKSDARRNLARERRRMERSASEQKDLIAASLKREADLIASKGEPDALKEISRLYDRALRNYGSSITGFKMMAEDYFEFMEKDEKLGPKAVRDIELAFQRVVETGSKEWFRANTETSIYKMICSYYRAVGQESRAVRLEKRYERLLRAAERGALR